ncbi:MAG: ribonuclease Z [Bacteroides sp.]
MNKFEVTILGSGSALSTINNNQTSQVVNVRDKLFMIDCGEGTQLQYRKAKLNFNRLGHIFISHLHGDHCFGLIGLISTFGMLGRTADIHIHAPIGLKALFQPLLDFFCNPMPFQVHIQEFNTKEASIIFEDRSLTVQTIPLKHRIPCAGFLFKEKKGLKPINREQIDYYKIPVHQINRLKAGYDYITPDGELIPNSILTFPAAPQRSFAYCSDTQYYEPIIEHIQGVNLLFHEATFANSELNRAKQTCHSTAQQAARIALQANAKQLLIGHFSARYPNKERLLNEAKVIFSQTRLANELETFQVE